MKIYPLKAAHGDALVVEAVREGRPFRIVIDGGPEDTAENICDYYLGLEHIDLLVLTHYDADHISGLLNFFANIKEKKGFIDNVWANCASIVEYDDEENVAAYEDAYVLSRHLVKLQKKGIIGYWCDDVTTEMAPVTIGPFKIEVLSPTKDIQNELLRRHRDYIEKEGLQDDPDLEEEVSYARVQKDATKELSALAASFRPTSTTFMNKTSIALQVTTEDNTILLLGDSDAKVITNSFIGLGATAEKPLKVDLIKMPHHGSKANISAQWFQLIDCSNFLFTTNGGDGGAYHPDRQTIACIDSWARRNETPITLYFNYPLSTIMLRNDGLLTDAEKERFTIVEVQTLIEL